MKLRKRHHLLALALLLAAAGLTAAGCTSYATPEQLRFLEQKQTEIKKTMNRAVNLKDEKAALEKRIADRKRAIEECNKLKQEVTSNITKIQK
jgi:deoxyadenosine/deoxycytidine kinase